MVKAWKETVVIPTYEVGAPEKNPIFLEKRVYQGSSGVVYPYPVIESIANEKTDHEWNAVFIENEYIKVMILPELGGRIQMAYDKIRQRHFVYYNHVIKPALVGLAGPWISGGIEFNWPQHHRPSTYMPVDCTIEENNDGSVTVWVNEMERMFHQRGQAGFTLRPGHAYLEIKGRLYNGTDMPQTFLWWANPAVSVNDHYRSVFPSDINAVFDHGKRAVSSFPIATGTYYKMDYSAGVDIANYKNIFVPTSYMAVNSKYNFEGGYEFDTEAGMLHVANHHFSPGKKQWTWGNGDFGRAWDRNLTDEDGPYIELMAGVYTENQPDFSWLMPYEEKEFTQYFLPYRELGVVKNASKDLLMNIEESGKDKAILKIFATSAQDIEILIRDNDCHTVFSEKVLINPENVYVREIDLKDIKISDLKVVILNNGKVALQWEAEPDEIRPIPDAAEAALRPEEIKTVEQLYLTGLHLEQYRHATFNPVDYYEEGLRRDPDDVRCNNALGLWYIRKGRFDIAEKYLEKAVKILKKRNPNPYEGEPIYNLGLALKYQGRFDEAYDNFYKATWNGAWQDAGYFASALISSMQRREEDALHEVSRSLLRNWVNPKARTLKAFILAKLGKKAEAIDFCDESLQLDLFNYGCLWAKYLLTDDKSIIDHMMILMHGNPHNYDEVALDLVDAGLWDEAEKLWTVAIEKNVVTPMTYYYLGWCQLQAGNVEAAKKSFMEGSESCRDFVFPNRLEAILALNAAIQMNPNDASAHHYLGNLYYDKRQYDLAISNWEKAAEITPQYPGTWRNLALGYFNKLNDAEKAVEVMEKAFALDETDSRILMELDQLYKRLGRDHSERIAFLQKYPDLIEMRDDLVLEEITLLNQTGNYKEAKEKLDSHIFHPWEGGEGKVPMQYQTARVELAKLAISEGKYTDAIDLLKECLDYPQHLGEGKLYGAQENDFYYLLGLCYRALGKDDEACECFRQATAGPTEPAAAMYYNDAKPDKIFYAGLSFRALGNENMARSYFNRLVDYGKQHLHDKVQMDYFAVSLPDLQVWDGSLDEMNRIHCLYMLALGYKGIGEDAKSARYLAEAQNLNINHQGITSFKSLLTLLN
ncbi:MAG: DUF5107 domain-containing protein [Muribaculaceae bacterium]|nr:DUF5107 domain-containing protein [Muribaculaceae bacterium]